MEHEQGGKDRAGYGRAVIADLALRLRPDFGRGLDERNLWFMRSFYQIFPKLNALRSELCWIHYRILLRVADSRARDQHWSTRQLDRQVSVKMAGIEPEQFIRDPYILELGKGFSFVARQKRVRFEEEDFYVDLVFYNYLLGASSWWT